MARVRRYRLPHLSRQHRTTAYHIVNGKGEVLADMKTRPWKWSDRDANSCAFLTREAAENVVTRMCGSVRGGRENGIRVVKT